MENPESGANGSLSNCEAYFPLAWHRFTSVTSDPPLLRADAIARPEPPQPTTAARRPMIARRPMVANTPVGSEVAASQVEPRRYIRLADAALRAARLRVVASPRATSLFGEATVNPRIDMPSSVRARRSTISRQKSSKELTRNGRKIAG